MKKKIFMACAALVVSVATAVGSMAYTDNQMFMNFNTENLTRQENGEMTCKCNEQFLGNNRCLVTNKDAICAMGNNIMCQTYNSNCH